MLLINYDAQLAAWAKVKLRGLGGSSKGYAQAKYEEHIGGGGACAMTPSGAVTASVSVIGKDGLQYEFSERAMELTGQIVLDDLSWSAAEIIKAHYLGQIDGFRADQIHRPSDRARALGIGRSAYSMRVERSVVEFGRLYEGMKHRVMQSSGARGRIEVLAAASNDSVSA